MEKARERRRLSTHDRKVRELARGLAKQGYRVRADIRGREKPRPVTSKRLVPDIEATRPGHRLIVEVETQGSQVRDRDQIKAFARHAAQRPDTTFRLVVTRSRKRKTASQRR